MRLFVALQPPAATIAEVEAAVAPLREAWPALRWVRSDLWHLTLAFLGEVDDQAAQNLAERLERAPRRHPRQVLSFGGGGAFPRAARATVVWTGVEGDRLGLGSLTDSVAAAARRSGAPPANEGRKARPHLTLARCRRPEDVRQLVSSLTGFHTAPWTASEIALVRSHLGESTQHEVIGTWPLGPGLDPRLRAP
jgi:RNA 2',3'-cyclic 3'-phosphodiesterase